eukprot:CAMPEP_0178396428 /NCGR_PEP_ID=MMETSP0689_2-20121128/13723_1 /TAXON_ID=160604 /ORGANISM="Amphidinium massartii, Strain CS-259" /LENGTH=723 /DNA_ID=CAMNT_0020017101 /DNA_START=34 /DNA_END=2202 /DNA_ORIENTATION=-
MDEDLSKFRRSKLAVPKWLRIAGAAAVLLGVLHFLTQDSSSPSVHDWSKQEADSDDGQALSRKEAKRRERARQARADAEDAAKFQKEKQLQEEAEAREEREEREEEREERQQAVEDKEEREQKEAPDDAEVEVQVVSGSEMDDGESPLSLSEAAYEQKWAADGESDDPEMKARWDRLDGGEYTPKHPPPAPSKYESTVLCDGVRGFNQSCIIRNCYLVPHSTGVSLHVVGDRWKTFPPMRLSTWGGEKFGDGKVPKIVKWDSVEQLEAHMSQKEPAYIRGLSLNLKLRYQWNWAHCFFDGIYPAYVAMTKFHRHREPALTFLDTHHWSPAKGASCPECMHPPKSPFSRDDACMAHQTEAMQCRIRAAILAFFSLGDPQGEYFYWQVARRGDRMIRFEEMIAGSGHHGQKMSGPDLSQGRSIQHLPKARGVLPLFQERMFRAHGVLRPIRSSSMQGRNPNVPLQARIADNERFGSGPTARKRQILMQLEEHYEANCQRTKVNFIHWGQWNTWAKQMNMLLTTDIFMTSIGSAQYYGLLLTDGSVLMQLGYEDDSIKGLPNHGEEYLLSTSTSIRVFSLPFGQVRRFPTLPELAAAVEHAADLIHSDFQVPVAEPERYLSACAQIMITASERDPYFKRILWEPNIFMHDPRPIFNTTARLRQQSGCPRKFACDLVYQVPRAKTDCHLDPAILNAVKREYKFAELVEATPTDECEVCVDHPGDYKP